MGGGTRLTKEIIGARCLLPKPRLVDSRVGLDFVSSEEQGDLTLGALGRIRAVDDVPPDHEREIPSDGPGLRLRGIRLAHHPTDGGHRAVSFEDHRHHRSRRDVRHERLEERFPLVFRVVRLSEGPRDPEHLHRHDLQAAAFEPADDLSHQGPLHGIRFQQDEGPLGGHHALFFAFFAFGAGASAASSSGCSRFRPFTWAHCPSSHDLKTRRPSCESFHAANSALSTWVTGFAPCFFFAQPRIEVRKVSLPTNPAKNLSTSPLGRSGPSRLSIKSPRSAGMSFPFGVSIVTVARPGSIATGASSATIASSATARPAARRNACVHGVHRGTRPRCSMFDWHLCEQNRKTVPSLRMNILPVPGSISLPQKEQDRRVGIVSPDRELARFPRRLAEHEDVADLDAPLHVARDDATLVPSIEDADLHLDRLAGHPRPADDLDHFRGDAVLVGHRVSSFPRTPHAFFIARSLPDRSSSTGFALPGSRIAMEAVAFPRPTATPSSCLLGT